MSDDPHGAIDSLYRSTWLYQMLFADRCHDLAFYKQETANATNVLDYGIGAGRVAVPLARAGHHVVGIDSSEDMLQLLAETVAQEADTVRERVSWHLGNACRMQLKQRFDAVICPFNGIAHHGSAPQLSAFFERVQKHLHKDGCFVFDVLIPDPALLAGSSTEIPWFRHPVTGIACRSTQSTVYDASTQMLTIRTELRPMEGEGENHSVELHLRQFFPEETMLILKHHGFLVERCDESLGDVLAYVCHKAM